MDYLGSISEIVKKEEAMKWDRVASRAGNLSKNLLSPYLNTRVH